MLGPISFQASNGLRGRPAQSVVTVERCPQVWPSEPQMAGLPAPGHRHTQQWASSVLYNQDSNLECQ